MTGATCPTVIAALNLLAWIDTFTRRLGNASMCETEARMHMTKDEEAAYQRLIEAIEKSHAASAPGTIIQLVVSIYCDEDQDSRSQGRLRRMYANYQGTLDLLAETPVMDSLSRWFLGRPLEEWYGGNLGRCDS